MSCAAVKQKITREKVVGTITLGGVAEVREELGPGLAVGEEHGRVDAGGHVGELGVGALGVEVLARRGRRVGDDAPPARGLGGAEPDEGVLDAICLAYKAGRPLPRDPSQYEAVQWKEFAKDVNNMQAQPYLNGLQGGVAAYPQQGHYYEHMMTAEEAAWYKQSEHELR